MGGGKPVVLDFSRWRSPAMDVTMPDGSRLEVLEPTKDLYEVMVAFDESGSGLAEKVGELYSLAAAILSNNSDGDEYDARQLCRELPVSACRELVAKYWDFTAGQVLAAKN